MAGVRHRIACFFFFFFLLLRFFLSSWFFFFFMLSLGSLRSPRFTCLLLHCTITRKALTPLPVFFLLLLFLPIHPFKSRVDLTREVDSLDKSSSTRFFLCALAKLSNAETYMFQPAFVYLNVYRLSSRCSREKTYLFPAFLASSMQIIKCGKVITSVDRIPKHNL